MSTVLIKNHMKHVKNILKKSKNNSAFTLVELILSSSISMIVILAGYYLSNIVSQANKNDKSQIELFSNIDSSTDFIIDEINSGKRIFINSKNISPDCNLPNGDFLLGISLPTQATESEAYSQSSGIGNSWNNIVCPVIYYLKNSQNKNISNQSFELRRYGPGIDKKGFYITSSFLDSLISRRISKSSLEDLQCSNSWTKLSKRGISICVDKYRRAAEISITANIKKSRGKDLYILKTSGANNRIQDDILMGISNNLNSINQSKVCDNSNSCHLFGTKIIGNITFIVDNSKSMKQFRIQGKRTFDLVKDQLIKSINNLRNTKFQVIAFGTKDKKMWDKPKLATSENRSKAIKWIKDLRANQGDTKPSSSIKKAIDNLETDQIIIISDGVPTILRPYCNSKNSKYSIDGCMTEYNEEKREDSTIGKARIDTISLGIGTFQTCNNWNNSLNWMGRLASSNGGKCSVIR